MDSLKFLKGAAIGVFALAGLFQLTTFTVDQTQYAVQIQLGDPISTITEPGLYFKVPFITRVFYMDNRLLNYDSAPGAVFSKDKKEMTVDNFAKWRVKDPLKYYETVTSRGVDGAQSLLDDIIYSQLREVLGKHTMSEIVSGQSQVIKQSILMDQNAANSRREIMAEVTKNAGKGAEVFGIQVADLRIKRADLPEANSLSVYGRMEAERRREAKRYRSEGEEEALKLRSNSDREKTQLLALAQKEAEEIRGRAEGKALKIYADSYNKDTDFFMFQRSHEAYRDTLKDPGTTLLLSTERSFFKYLK